MTTVVYILATHGGVSPAQTLRYGRIIYCKDCRNVLSVTKAKNVIFVPFSKVKRAFWLASRIAAVQTNSKMLPITFFDVMTAIKHGAQEEAV